MKKIYLIKEKRKKKPNIEYINLNDNPVLLNPKLKIKDIKARIKAKTNKESQPNENNNEENKEQIPTNEAIPKKKKMRDPRLYDTEKMELVDFGEHTYQKLLDSISDLNGLMWIGRLSPSKSENMFDNYIKIINKI